VKDVGFIDLGSMKGSMGDQNYDVPSGSDLNKYQGRVADLLKVG
jgi:hypothetical protein